MSVRQRIGLARWGVMVILLGAVLPNVTYMDHWPIWGGGEDHEVHGEAEADAHAAHCHTGPSKCSNEQALVGSWWVGDEPMRISPNPPSHEIESKRESTVAEPLPAIITPPPQNAQHS